MSLTVTFSNSITFPLFDEYGKGTVVEIKTVFWPVYRAACREDG